MALDGEGQIILAHAGTIIADANELSAALFDLHADAARAGIQRILHQLLHGSRRPFDHLAGSDAIDQNRIEAADSHASFSNRRGVDTKDTLDDAGVLSADCGDTRLRLAATRAYAACFIASSAARKAATSGAAAGLSSALTPSSAKSRAVGTKALPARS